MRELLRNAVRVQKTHYTPSGHGSACGDDTTTTSGIEKPGSTATTAGSGTDATEPATSGESDSTATFGDATAESDDSTATTETGSGSTGTPDAEQVLRDFLRNGDPGSHDFYKPWMKGVPINKQGYALPNGNIYVRMWNSVYIEGRPSS